MIEGGYDSVTLGYDFYGAHANFLITYDKLLYYGTSSYTNAYELNKIE